MWYLFKIIILFHLFVFEITFFCHFIGAQIFVVHGSEIAVFRLICLVNVDRYTSKAKHLKIVVVYVSNRIVNPQKYKHILFSIHQLYIFIHLHYEYYIGVFVYFIFYKKNYFWKSIFKYVFFSQINTYFY